jgi:hypothetical protein
MMAMVDSLAPIAKDIRPVFNTEKFSDVCILSKEEKKILCHKFILGTRSPLFHKLFKDNPALQSFTIQARYEATFNFLLYLVK